MDNYHITKNGDQWQFSKEGGKKAIKNSGTKAEAISHMRGHMADKKGSVKIHKEDGRFQEERTYQRKDDPSASKG
ncbi:DUF2188 domain-containing protein [Salinisphaera aquimarina]|uniref:DUF2188 domain-containing protein n=1 Tax=Salinisphaera aquimarina TaxID=2094031 RepID=A0ABV7EV76_9GAMM